MNDAKEQFPQPAQETPKPDARQIRVEVEARVAGAFSPANLFTEQRWNELRSLAGWLTVLLSVEPMIKASVKKHPNDWNRIFRLFQARLEIQPQIPRLRARYGAHPELFRKQVVKLVRAHARSIKLPQSATPDNFHIPANVPLHAVRALDEFVPLIEAMLRGETKIVGAHPNQFVEFFKAFSAGKPGPVPSQLTEEIRRFYAEAPEDQKPTEGAIGMKFFPHYATADGHQRRRIREDVIRPAIKPIKGISRRTGA